MMISRREVLAAGVGFAAASAIPARAAGAAGPLVDVKWLKDNLGSPGLVILDVTSVQFYGRGHVPGAVFAPYGSWREKRGEVSGLLPGAEKLAALIGGYGVGNGDHVVVVPAGFSDGDVGMATRVYWTLKTAGHDKVSILDGGTRAWVAAGMKAESKANEPAPKQFAVKMNDSWLATADDVRKALKAGKPQIIDNRPLGQHVGVTKSGSVAKYGAIPGSIHIPEAWMVHKGKFRPPRQLARIFSLSGVGQGETIHTCNTGHRATLGWFARSQILGLPARLYDASMAEWSRLPDAPVEVKMDIHGG